MRLLRWRHFLLSLVVLLSGVSVCGSAYSQDHRSSRINVEHGKMSRIKWHSTVDGRCRQEGFPIYKILLPPTHGKLSYRKEMGAVGAPIPDPQVPIPPHCLGVRMLGRAIYYQSDPGFRGTDRVRVQTYFAPSHTTIENTIVITVR